MNNLYIILRGGFSMNDNLKYYLIACAITFVCIALFATLLPIFLKNKSKKIKMIPIQVVFFVLVALEVWKIYTLIARDESFVPLRYPIVFCSLVMYTYPLFCFKKNRFSDLAMGFSVIPCIIIFALFVAVQSGYVMNMMQIHSYVFHGAMMAVAVYLISSGLYTFRFKDYFKNGLLVAAYILLCTIVSLILGADLSLFGPQSGFLGVVYNNVGYAVGNVLLMAVVMLISMGIYAALSPIHRKRVKEEDERALQEGGVK